MFVCLKGGETGGTSNCPGIVRQENLQEERAREASDCPTGSNVIPTATNIPALATCATNPPPSASSPPPLGILTAGMIKGNSSSYVAGVVEWTFAESQSSIQGRTGSNACAFIALIMGKMWMNGGLLWPRDALLPEPWKQSLYEAMIKGNKIHDDLFDHQAVDLAVKDAVSLADNQCGVQSLGQQIDILGLNPVHQLANFLIQEAQNHKSKSCSVIMTQQRAMLLAVNSDSAAMIADSHSHGNDGAIIACTQPGSIHLLAQWLDALMNDIWQHLQTIASITKVFYF